MGLRNTTSNPLFRWFAALALVAFFAAHSLCFIHCHLGSRRADSPMPSCHSAASTGACHSEGDSSSQAPPESAACFTLQHLAGFADPPAPAVPDFNLLCVLTLLAHPLDVAASVSAASFFRQANYRNWILNPEVSLGPAFRSLAPPLFG